MFLNQVFHYIYKKKVKIYTSSQKIKYDILLINLRFFISNLQLVKFKLESWDLEKWSKYEKITHCNYFFYEFNKDLLLFFS